MEQKFTPEQGPIREVRLPENMDPALAVGYMAIIAQLHASNRALREALHMPAGPSVRFAIGDQPVEGEING